MDTGTNIVPDETASNTFAIPNFTGSLMLKIDGKQGMDVTSVFLLVSRDETPPVLTLSDPVFFADRDTGAVHHHRHGGRGQRDPLWGKWAHTGCGRRQLCHSR